jgi:hypothetical protein
MEEAAHMDPKVFKTVVVPLFGVVNTAVLAISSPDDDQNYYSELAELKDADGGTFFQVIQIGLACQSCIDAGKAAKCKHKLNTLPPWKSAELQDRVERILANDEGLIARETKGLMASDNAPQYPVHHIDAFKKRPTHHFERNPIVLHTGIDPHGGGQGSDFGLTTIAYDNNKWVVSFTMYDANTTLLHPSLLHMYSATSVQHEWVVGYSSLDWPCGTALPCPAALLECIDCTPL